jgi:hypothetical protein
MAFPVAMSKLRRIDAVKTSFLRRLTYHKARVLVIVKSLIFQIERNSASLNPKVLTA